MNELATHLKSICPHFIKTGYHKISFLMRKTERFLACRKVVCRVRQASVIIEVSSELELFRVRTYSTKEPETLDWLDQNLRDQDVFIDVGANIGLYSLYAAKIRPQALVYAFEPESQNFSRLCNNIVLNSAKNVTPCNIPLADEESFGHFYVSELQAGSSEHLFSQPNNNSDLRPQAIALKQGAFSLPLDDLVYKFGLPAPTLLKIDVDGIEEKIVNGAKNVLRSKTLRSVLIELNLKKGTPHSQAEEFLSPFGFKLTRQSAWIYDYKNGWQAQNYIFHK